MDWIEEYIKEELARKETKEVFEIEKDLKRVYSLRLLCDGEFVDIAHSLYQIIEPTFIFKLSRDIVLFYKLFKDAYIRNTSNFANLS